MDYVTRTAAEDPDAWIDTFSGPFWPAAAAPSDVQPLAIAHALANLCRFGGHTTKFYSVAQHSVLCVQQLPADAPAVLRRAVLLHDATEAYLVDVPRPIKRLLPDYRDIEAHLQRVIAERFLLPDPLPPIVHEIDARMLITEASQLMAGQSGAWWREPGRPLPFEIAIEPWSPPEAELAFIAALVSVWPPEACHGA